MGGGVFQGLLKVAVQSARCQDKQNQMERKELKVELDKERDARQTLQRQLSCELQTRGGTEFSYQLSQKPIAQHLMGTFCQYPSRRG